MNLSALTFADLQALRRAMEYWVGKWDFECPTLFGIEIGELEKVLQAWPAVPTGSEVNASLAMQGALREMLYGASAVPKDRLPERIGMSYDDTHSLFTKVHAIVDPILTA